LTRVFCAQHRARGELQRRATVDPPSPSIDSRDLLDGACLVAGRLNRRQPVDACAAHNHAELVHRAQHLERFDGSAGCQLHFRDAVLRHRHAARDVDNNHHGCRGEHLTLAHIQIHGQNLGDRRFVIAAWQEGVLAANHGEADARIAHGALDGEHLLG
jgi:hypothetical protein